MADFGLYQCLGLNRLGERSSNSDRLLIFGIKALARKATYQELEQKVRKLEKKIVTYSQAKRSLKESLEKQVGLSEKIAEPEMAVDVLDQEDAEKQPLEQALIAEHLFRKTIEESIPSGIFGIDLQGRPFYVNQGFCDMVGWNEDELLSLSYPFVYWPQHNFDAFDDDFNKLARAILSSGGIELPFVRKSGEQFWGLVNGTQLMDSKGQPIGYLMSVADISAQKHAEHAMRALSSRLVDRQESERKFVAQELHDGVGGKLTAVKYSLEKLINELQQKKEPLKAPLGDILSIVHDTIDETQRIYRNLHPAILDDLGLNAALRSLCREFMEVYNSFTIDTDFEPEENWIQEPLKILIYRILQEALNNVAKHSQASRVRVSLRPVKNKIELVIKDNGQGFDLTEVQAMDYQERGIGLESIKERTVIFGGSLDIQSTFGQGTTIRVTWPC
jgi:PAS domain S-box-containing protein